jgi:hypothetical protein
MGLVARANKPGSSVEILASSSCLNIRFFRLNAAAAYFSAFFEIAPTIYSQLPMGGWGRLISATFVLYRLSTRTPVAGWDYHTVRQSFPLEICIVPLCLKLRVVAYQTADPISIPQDLYAMMNAVFQDVHAAFIKLKTDQFEAVDDDPPHQRLNQEFSLGSGQSSNLWGWCPFLNTMHLR